MPKEAFNCFGTAEESYWIYLERNTHDCKKYLYYIEKRKDFDLLDSIF